MTELSLRTKAYLFSVYIAGLAILVWKLLQMHVSNPWLLAALCVAGILAAVFKVEGSTSRSHYTISFLIYGFAFAGLGLSAALTVIAISSLVEWIVKRPPWFIQVFNATCYVLVTYAAYLIYILLNPAGDMESGRAVLALVAAMAAFTLLNHLLVGVIVLLARGENFQKSGVFDVLPLMIDMTLLTLGGSMVIVWRHNPFALVLFSLPLYLIYSTLRVPALERQTETDSKTGLFNHGYFMQQVENELKRANRFDRPMAIIMADLDLLRNINNTYGHLAGDEVLIRISSIFKQEVREYDVVARFGGEEFAILMPESTVEQAFARAETLRRAIEKAAFVVSTSVTPINVTISIGIAGRERFDQKSVEIIHNADTALYHAKLKGRNKTYVCADDTYASLLADHEENAPPPEPEAPAPHTETEAAVYSAASAVRVKSTEPHPMVAAAESVTPEPPKQTGSRTGGLTAVNLYIAVITVVSLLAWWGVIQLRPVHLDAYSGLEWLSLLTFAVFVVLTEWFSIELYVKRTTVSTSAVPILAGTLLFGPFGALVLSAAFAVTAFVKYRSPLSRLFFNFGNQLLAAMIYSGLLALTGKTLVEFPVVVQLGICLAASVIVYLFTTALVAAGVSIDVRQSAVQVWKEQYAWLITSYVGMGFIAYALIFGYKNDHLLGIMLMVVPLLLWRASQKQYVDRTRTMVGELHEKQRIMEKSSEEIRALNSGLLDTLAEVIDLGDPYVLGHSMRVAELATQIAGRMGLHEKQVDVIRSASMLHDIGKLGVPASILSKPARLTTEEYETVKKHVSLGAALLEKSRSLQPLAPIINCHHERYDGNGYPGGHKASEIPLEARIIAVSDAVETMASDRPYSRRKPDAAIIDELRRCSGSQFDPLVVEAAVDVLLMRTTEAKPARVPSVSRLNESPVRRA